MDLLEIKKNLCFGSVIVQAQAYASLLKKVNWTQTKSESASLLFRCLVDFGTNISNWTAKELLKRSQSGELNNEVLAREVLGLLNACDKATVDNLIRLLLHSSVDLPRTCSLIIAQYPNASDNLLEHIAEFGILSDRSIVLPLLLKDSLPTWTKAVLAEKFLKTSEESHIYYLDCLADKLPQYLLHNVSNNEETALWFLERSANDENRLYSKLATRTFYHSQVVELTSLITLDPSVLLAGKIGAHPALLPTLLSLVAAESEIEKLSAGSVDASVLQAAKAMISIIQSGHATSATQVENVNFTSSVALMNRISSSVMEMDAYVRQWSSNVNISRNAPESMSFLVGILSTASQDTNTLKLCLQLLCSICEENHALANSLVLVFLSLFTKSWFPVDKELIIQLLPNLCVHRVVVSSVVKFLLIVCQQRTPIRFTAIQAIGDVFEKYDSIYDQIKSLLFITDGEDIEWSRAKLKLVERVCKVSEQSDDLLPHLSELLSKSGPILPDVFQVISVLVEEGVFDVAVIAKQSRVKGESNADVLAIHARILSLATRDKEQEEIAQQVLPELWNLLSHEIEKVRVAAWRGLAEYSWNDVSAFLCPPKPTEDEECSPLKSTIDDCSEDETPPQKVLNKICRIVDEEEASAAAIFLHKMVACDLEDLPRPLYNKKYVRSDYPFSSVIAKLSETKLNEDATASFLALFPSIVSSASTSRRTPTALRLLNKCLTQVPPPDTSCEWTALRYLAGWRATVQTVFDAMSSTRVDQVGTEDPVINWVRDHLCDEIRRALLQCEESLCNVTVALTYLTLILRDKQESSDGIAFRPWLNSVIEFLLSQANSDHQTRSQPIFQCEVKHSDFAADIASLCLQILGKHLSSDDLSFFDVALFRRMSISATNPSVSVGEQSGSGMTRFPVGRQRKSSLSSTPHAHWLLALSQHDSSTPLSRVSHGLLSGQQLNPSDLQTFDRAKLVLIGAAVGCDPLVVETCVSDVKSLASVEEVMKTVEEVTNADGIQTILHLCADLSDIELEKVRPAVQRLFEKLLRSGDQDLKSAIWTGLANLHAVHFHKEVPSAPPNYSMLPQQSLIRETDQVLRTCPPLIRRIILLSWMDQMRQNDGRPMPPLDVSFMMPYAEESEATRDALIAIAAQFENRKLLACLTSRHFLNTTGKSFVKPLAEQLCLIVKLLPDLIISHVTHFILDTIKADGFVNEELIQTVCAQAHHDAVLSEITHFLPKVESSITFAHPLWRNLEGRVKAGKSIKCGDRIVSSWCFMQGEDMKVADIMELLKMTANTGERNTMMCLFGWFAQKMSTEQRSDLFVEMLTAARIEAAHGGQESLVVYWLCLVCLIVSTPSRVPFVFLTSDDSLTVDMTRRRINYSMLHLDFYLMVGEITDKLTEFLISALPFSTDNDTRSIKKLVRILLSRSVSTVSSLINEHNLWKTLLSD